MKELSSWKKSFFTIYFGQGFSMLSSSIVQFSIIWWITIQTNSALALSVASIVGLLPQAVIGPFAGVWIDRYNRKTIMIIADSMVAISSLILGIVLFLGTSHISLIFLILFIRALGETFHKTAMQACIPQLVPDSELTKAGGLGQMINSVCTMISPMLGALLMSISTLKYIMFIDVLGAIMAISILSAVKIPKHKVSDSKFNVISDMKEGINEIRNNRLLLKVTVPVIISTMAFAPIGTLLPLMINGHFNGGAWHNGFAQTLFSIGMLVSAMVISVTGGIKKEFSMIYFGIISFGITSIVAGALPSSMFWIFCVLIFILGATGMIFNIPYIAYIQKSISSENLGKVVSIVTSFMSLAAPIGMFIAGPFSELFGPNIWMVIAGIVMIFTGVTFYLTTREVLIEY